ncbi:hypothetical protein QUA30_09490 [Microcoleus sp. Pol14C2]|uniref:hypothetical protein n=1 Tax=unclassified Microcoleus TaxID=2642155 RepID=UPI002FD63E09
MGHGELLAATNHQSQQSTVISQQSTVNSQQSTPHSPSQVSRQEEARSPQSRLN